MRQFKKKCLWLSFIGYLGGLLFCYDFFNSGCLLSLAAIIPIKIYSNAESDKDQILQENKEKSGIYMWKNLINDKQYIGSAVDLSNRLSSDSSTTSMENTLKRGNSHIYRALLKHGHDNFSLTILEYCDKEKCIERENYYLSSENHEYNILEKAGSRLGSKHSELTKIKISDANKGENHPFFGQNHSEKTINQISDAMTGKNHSNETKQKISDAMPTSIKIEVTDIPNNTTTSYNSMSEAAIALNINKSVINLDFIRNQQKPYKGIYTFKKVKK